MALPTDRSPSDPADDPAAHAADHNTLAGLHNSFEGTTPASFEAAGAVTTHAAAADPHAGYLKESVISGLATPAIALGTAAAAGSTLTPIRSDSTIAAFDATVPNVIEPDDAAAAGVINFAARRDHAHGIVAAVAGASTFADAAAEGSATSFARSDHKHSREANPVTAHEGAADPHTGYLRESVISGLATPAIVLGSAAAAGSTLTPIRSDATIAAFDATNPSTQAFGDAAVVGTAAFAARRDHKHAMPAGMSAALITSEAWTAYTPTLTQSATVTKTVQYAKYQRVGRTIHLAGRLDATSAGTAANTVVVGLPVAAASSLGVFGSGHIYDSSTTTRYVCSFIGVSTTTASFAHDTSGGNFWGAAPNIALAAGDVLQFAVSYEAAS